MIQVSVMYPNRKDTQFDMDYYMNSHIPLVHKRLKSKGLIKSEVSHGIGSAEPGSAAPFICIANLYFEKLEDFQQGFSAHGKEILADIPNYTNVKPQLQISEIVES